MRPLVLGIGNILFSDEGAGVRLVQHLSNHYPHWPVNYLDGGTLSFDLIQPLTSSRHIIILDAANIGLAPGQHKCYANEAMDHFLNHHAQNVHEVSLSELFDACRLLGQLPVQRVLIGIQPGSLEMKLELSNEVSNAFPEITQTIERYLSDWGQLPIQSQRQHLKEKANDPH